MDWLLTPLSGAAEHHIAPWAMWHARCMVLAWGILLPLGALTARFFKVVPGQNWPRQLDHKAWWHAHRFLQWGGIGAMLIGLGLAWRSAGAAGAFGGWHAWLGWTVCALAAAQIAGGLARGSKGGPTSAQMRGDHYDMTAWRRLFERLHKSLGWLSVLLSVAAITTGLVLADAPRWMALALGTWWLSLIGAFVVLQRSGRCIDTYQAIWGPDPKHPGNRMLPIGWGVRRPQA